MTVRTRFEPSPTGSLHVGHAMTASFNWMWARKHGGRFVLRVADTDAARVTDEGLVSVLEDLRWLGLQWDEGPEVGGPHAPYFQSQRAELYREAARTMLEHGHAYRCFCTPEELEQRRRHALAEGRPPGYDGRCRNLTEAEVRAFEDEGRPAAVRFRVPEGETRFADLVHGEVVIEYATIADFVIVRADGSPLYVLAAGYDDLAMGITHVIRGEDILPATSRQMLLARALGWEDRIPTYAHIPLIVGGDRAPLSKRHGATAVAEYRNQGFLPDVLLNYCAILNWSLGDGVTERFTLEELTRAFDPRGVTRNPSAFDGMKLTAFNGERIRELSDEEFVERIEPFLVRAGALHEPVSAEERRVLLEIAPHVKERVKRLDEAPAQLAFFFEEPEPDERAARVLDEAKTVATLEAGLDILEKVEPWEAAEIQRGLQEWADGAGIKRKEAFQPLRAAVTGSLVSPPLFESLEVLGRDTTVARVRSALRRTRGA